MKREQITEEERAPGGAERRAAYRAGHREELAAKQRAYNAAHPGRYAKNREKFAAAKRERYAANRDWCRAVAKSVVTTRHTREGKRQSEQRAAKRRRRSRGALFICAGRTGSRYQTTTPYLRRKAGAALTRDAEQKILVQVDFT